MPQAKTYGHRLPPVEVPDELRARLERAQEELQRLHVAGDFPYGPWNLSNIMRVAMGFGVRSIEQEIDRAKREAATRPLLEEMARENMHRFGPQEAQVRARARVEGQAQGPIDSVGVHGARRVRVVGVRSVR